MPTTIGEPFSQNILTDPTAPEPSILPIHVAQYRQNVEHQHRKKQQAQGVELKDLPPQGHHQQAPPRHSTELEDSHIPSARSSSDSILEDDPLLDESAPSSSQMKRARRYKNKSPARLDLSTTASQNGHANGHANGSTNGTIHVDTANGEMNNRIEFRRKRPSIDSPDAAAITAHLMGRESFSLDNEPPQTPQTPGLANNSFWDLPAQDRRNFLLLVLLYFLQGIPMGLAGGSVPFLLKKYLSYGQIGVFSLASYPYSLKLLWSPIVDAVWSPKVGRRKSWILPIQTISGLGMIYLGGRVDGMMNEAGANDGAGVWNFMSWWFLLVFMCATQDIAVDGWALTLLSPQNIAYASTAQTVGLTAGGFLSHTVFLAFNAPDFANRWFRTVPKDIGIMTLGGYLEFWGWAYLVVTLGLALLKREEKTKERDGILEVYRSMIGILKLKSIQKIIVVHLISKLGFQANDAVTALKLLDKGFGQENMALVVLIDFPFEISLGYYAGKWSTKYTPMRLWCWAFVGRLIAAVIAQFVVMIYPKGGVTTWYLFVIIITNIFSTFMNTIMFVAVSAFHARVADPAIGGTYMTLLATVSNLGGTFPRFFILKLVDAFTRATCFPPVPPSSIHPSPLNIPPSSAPNLSTRDLTTPSKIDPLLNPIANPITEKFSCVLEAARHRCKDGGGTCDISIDGYYITNVLCVIVGVVTFWGYIKPTALFLQGLPLRAWRLGYTGPVAARGAI